MSNVNYVNTVQVGKENTVAAEGTALTSLADGQFALVEAKTLVALGAGNAAGDAGALSKKDTVFIAKGNGDGTFDLSSPIVGENVKHYAGTAHVAQEFMAWSQSAPEVLDEREYRYTILIKDDQRPHGQKQTRETYNYKTGTGATELEIMNGLNELFWTRKQNASEKKYQGRFVTQTITGGAPATAVAADNAATYVKGSKTVSFAGALTYNVGVDTFAEGDVVRVADYTDINGDTSYAYYTIKAVDTVNNTITLNVPFSGTSGAAFEFVDATSFAEPLTFSVVAEDPMAYWNKIDTFELVMFETAIGVVAHAGGVIDSTVEEGASSLVKFTPPTGNGYQVFDLVYFAQGYSGVNSRTRWFDSNINPENEAVVTESYDVITIGFDTAYRKDFQDVGRAPKSANLCFVAGGTQSTGFVDILNDYFADVVGFDPVSV